jgi:hypothetical protein
MKNYAPSFHLFRFGYFDGCFCSRTNPGRTVAHEVRRISKKIEDIVIYKDEILRCTPSIVRRKNGELLVAFGAPERRLLGGSTTHTDPNSYLVLMRLSADAGKSWTQTPELIYANPFGGSQDPCLVQLRAARSRSSYGWALPKTRGSAKLTDVFHHGNFAFLGGYALRSKDADMSGMGRSSALQSQEKLIGIPFGQPLPAYNRGAMCQAKNDKVYWTVAATTSNSLHEPRSTC